MKVGEKRHGEIDHLQASGNHTSAPAEASEPVALPTVVVFNAIDFRFGLDQLMGRNQFGIATQMIGIVDGYLPHSILPVAFQMSWYFCRYIPNQKAGR